MCALCSLVHLVSIVVRFSSSVFYSSWLWSMYSLSVCVNVSSSSLSRSVSSCVRYVIECVLSYQHRLHLLSLLDRSLVSSQLSSISWYTSFLSSSSSPSPSFLLNLSLCLNLTVALCSYIVVLRMVIYFLTSLFDYLMHTFDLPITFPIHGSPSLHC